MGLKGWSVAAALSVAVSTRAEAERRQVVVLDAPSNLGLRPPRPGAQPGASKLAGAIRARRLVERLDAKDAGRLTVPKYSPVPDPVTWFRNGQGLASFAPRLADRVAALVGERKFLLVLGGDCSNLIGSALGLRSLGRYGLVFIDGHDDFSVIRRLDDYKGILAAAGLDLAVVTGYAPGGLSDLRGLRPYVREEDVVLFGLVRDPLDSADYATEVLDQTRMLQLRAEHIRQHGAADSARAALKHLDAHPLNGIWVHLDADVLSESVMPAVDSPNPLGLEFEQLEAALRILVSDPRVVGMDLDIYDPELDPQGIYGDRLTDMLVRAFGF